VGRLIGSVLIALLASGSASAQQTRFDAQGLRFAPGLGAQTDLVSVWRPDVGRAGSYGATLLFDYADATLVTVTETADGTTEQPLMQNLVGGTGLFRVALHERIGLGIELPVSLSSTRAGQSQPPSLRDIRVSVPVELLDGDRIGLGVVGFADLPTGPGARLLGNGAGGGGLFAGSYPIGRFDLTGNLGLSVHPSAELLNITGTPKFLGAAGVSARVTDTLTLATELDGGVRRQQQGPAGVDAPLEAIGSARLQIPGGPRFLGGVGTHLTSGAGTARLRAFFAINFSIDRDRDFDADGIADLDDGCISEPEVHNRWKDEDGCPDQLSEVGIRVLDPEGVPLPGLEVLDFDQPLGTTDDRGQIQLVDQMPGTSLSLSVAVPEGRRFREVEPTALTLAEGDNSADLAFRWKSGSFRVVVVDESGNPVDAELVFRGADAPEGIQIGQDGDAITSLPPGKWSLVIENADYGLSSQEVVFTGADSDQLQTFTFVLKAREVATTVEEVVVLQAVNFKLDSDELEPASMALLDEVAANLLKHQEIHRVEVQGHTSSEGSDEYNLDLSQRRMESVVDYLSTKGLERDRLEPVGYGESCPLSSNDTDQGRSQNRRVQFIVIDPPPTDGIPCHDGVSARRAQSLEP